MAAFDTPGLYTGVIQVHCLQLPTPEHALVTLQQRIFESLCLSMEITLIYVHVKM